MSLVESFVPSFEYTAAVVAGRDEVEPDRLLATIVFEDVVGSTELISRIGDAA